MGKLRTTLAPDSVTQARPSCPPQPPLAALPTAPAVLPKHAHTLRPGARPPPRAWPEAVHGWGRILTDCPLLREAFLGFRRTRHRPHSHLCTAADFCCPASPPAFLKPFSRGSFKIANQMKSASYSRPASGGPPGPAPRAAPAASPRHPLPPLSLLTPFGALAAQCRHSGSLRGSGRGPPDASGAVPGQGQVCPEELSLPSNILPPPSRTSSAARWVPNSSRRASGPRGLQTERTLLKEQLCERGGLPTLRTFWEGSLGVRMGSSL